MDGNPADRPNPMSPPEINAQKSSPNSAAGNQKDGVSPGDSTRAPNPANSDAKDGRYTSLSANQLRQMPNPDELING